ncbi:MAG TPA: cyanophycin synthetase, partial [bacterium]
KGFRWEGPGFKKSFYLPHLPDFQISNAGLALAGIKLLESQGVQVSPTGLQKSFASMRWPGRFETVKTHPLLVMDGAHNPGAARVLVSSLKTSYPRHQWIVLNGFLKDKDYDEVAKLLKPLTALSIVTDPESDRAETGRFVFKAWEKAGVRSLWVKDWKKALGLALAKTGIGSPYSLLITGSLYLLGDCRKELVGLRGLDRI